MADQRHKQIKRFIDPFRVTPGSQVLLAATSTRHSRGGLKKKAGTELLAREGGTAEQTTRIASRRRTPRRAGRAPGARRGRQGRHDPARDERRQPAGRGRHSFKVPSAEELDHDFLWRYLQRLPGRGRDRHLQPLPLRGGAVVRVHPENLDRQRLPRGRQGQGRLEAPLPRDQRLGALPHRQRHPDRQAVPERLAEEQRSRLLQPARPSRPQLEVLAADVHERAYWDQYQNAFSQMLSHTSTEWAPWYVIPADHKWFARIAAAPCSSKRPDGDRPAASRPSIKQGRAQLAEAKADARGAGAPRAPRPIRSPRTGARSRNPSGLVSAIRA